MQRWYDIYGGINKRFTGSCTVPGKNGPLSGTFDCVQINDGNIMLKVETIGDQDTMQAIPEGGDMAQETAVAGITKDGKRFLAKCYATIRSQANIFGEPGLVFEYGVTEVIVDEAADVPATRFRYGLTNLKFAPNAQGNRKYGTLGNMVFRIKGLEPIVVRPVRDYSRIEKVLKAQRSIAVTTVASTSVPEDEFQQFCSVLSIAQGTVVNWIWREEYNGKRKVRTLLRSTITRPYSVRHPIPTDRPGSVPAFLGKVWHQYVKLEDQYRLRAISHLMALANNDRNTFLEARGIQYVIVLEIITAIHAGLAGKTHRMAQNMYDQGARVWAKELEASLSKAYPGEPSVAQMAQVARSSLNRTPFKERLLRIASEVGVPAEQTSLRDDVDLIGRTRNKLIHEGRFHKSGPDQTTEFFLLQTFTDRLLLRLLGYSGLYRTFSGGKFVVAELQDDRRGGDEEASTSG